MDKIEQLEKRIEKLEKKLQSKEDKTPNWEKFAKAALTHWDEIYRTKFEKKYSFEEDSKYSRFDLKRAIEEAEGKKPPKKLEHWNSIYNELKQVKEDQDGNHYWDELLYLSKSAVKIYSESIIKYILREGKYVDLGGPREQIETKEKGYKIIKELPEEYFHKNGRWKGHPKWDKVEPILRKEIDKEYGSIRSIKDYYREQEK